MIDDVDLVAFFFGRDGVVTWANFNAKAILVDLAENIFLPAQGVSPGVCRPMVALRPCPPDVTTASRYSIVTIMSTFPGPDAGLTLSAAPGGKT